MLYNLERKFNLSSKLNLIITSTETSLVILSNDWIKDFNLRSSANCTFDTGGSNLRIT